MAKAIMDNHEIDTLVLKASNGNTVTKGLTVSGLDYETGTVEVATQGGAVVINHSLNSTKVMGYVVPIAGETYSTEGNNVYNAGYKAYTQVFCNLPEAVNGSFTLDLSSYHDAGVQTINYSTTTKIPAIGAVTATPWTSQSSADDALNNIGATKRSLITFTNSSVTIASGSNSNDRSFMKGTFRYLIVKFG